MCTYTFDVLDNIRLLEVLSPCVYLGEKSTLHAKYAANLMWHAYLDMQDLAAM